MFPLLVFGEVGDYVDLPGDEARWHMIVVTCLKLRWGGLSPSALGGQVIEAVFIGAGNDGQVSVFGKVVVGGVSVKSLIVFRGVAVDDRLTSHMWPEVRLSLADTVFQSLGSGVVSSEGGQSLVSRAPIYRRRLH